MTTIAQPTSAYAASSATLILSAAGAAPEPEYAARPAPASADHDRADSHVGRVGVQLHESHTGSDTQEKSALVELQFCAAFLDDVEGLRVATENRVRAFEQEGFDAGPYLSQLTALTSIEHEATLALRRVVRRHPLGEWVNRTVGVGEKQAGRLIAAIGDITYNHLEDRPRRGPAELWAYCGYRPDQKRRKGVRSNWSASAKMRAFLIAESCIKHSASPYRAVYDAARANWETRDTTPGHRHNHALRCVAKRVLRDLFLEARRVGA